MSIHVQLHSEFNGSDVLPGNPNDSWLTGGPADGRERESFLDVGVRVDWAGRVRRVEQKYSQTCLLYTTIIVTPVLSET